MEELKKTMTVTATKMKNRLHSSRANRTHMSGNESELSVYPSETLLLHIFVLYYSCCATHFRAHVTISPWYSTIFFWFLFAFGCCACGWIIKRVIDTFYFFFLWFPIRKFFNAQYFLLKNPIHLTVAGVLVSIARSEVRQFMYRSIDSLYFNGYIYAPTTMMTTTTTTYSKSILHVLHRCYRFAFDVLFSTFWIVQRRTPTSTHHTNSFISMWLSSIFTPTYMYRD